MSGFIDYSDPAVTRKLDHYAKAKREFEAGTQSIMTTTVVLCLIAIGASFVIPGAFMLLFPILGCACFHGHQRTQEHQQMLREEAVFMASLERH